MANQPRVLAILPGFIPSTLMQVINPCLELERNKFIKFYAKPEYLVGKRDLNWADIVIFCRNTEPKYSHILDYLIKSKIPIIYDIDDNFFDLPLNNTIGRYHRSPERINYFTRYIQSAQLVRVYSYVMKERLSALNSNVTLVTPPLNWSLIKESKQHKKKDLINLIYTTSRYEDTLWSIFLPSILQIIQEYPTHVEMTFWGYQPKGVKGLKNFNYIPMINNYNQFLKLFSQQGFDIGLAPLLDDEFHRSKTNNKFREYSACKISGVYSNINVYNECIENGVTGLIVNNDSQSWYQAIRTLIENTELRTQIKEQAYKYARTNYSEDLFQAIWFDHIHSVIKHSIIIETPVLLPPPLNENIHNAQFQIKYKIIKKIYTMAMWIWSKASRHPAHLASWFRVHVYNLWMSIKINYLKRV